MTVFTKTEIAIEEIKGNTRRLGARDRQVLVMVDGKRTQESLENFFVHYDVKDILSKLTNSLFIETIERQHQRLNQNKATNDQAFTQLSQQYIFLDAQVLRPIQSLLIETTRQHLGILGKDLIAKIENIKEYDELMSFMSKWHMAMRESKTGRYEVSELMLKISGMI